MPSNETPSHESTSAEDAPASEEMADPHPGFRILERLEVEAPEILTSLPEEQRQKLLRIVTAQVVMRHHCGPLPSPEDIAAYNAHITDGADRIMAMAEKQSDHRRHLERTIVESQATQNSRGQLFGFLIGVFGIAAGSLLTYCGHAWVGAGIAGTTVISLVYAFVTGQRVQGQDSPPE